MAHIVRSLFNVTWLSGFKRTSLTIDNKNSDRNTLPFAVAVRGVWNLIPLHSPPPDLPELYFHTINLESIFSIFVKDPLPVGVARRCEGIKTRKLNAGATRTMSTISLTSSMYCDEFRSCCGIHSATYSRQELRSIDDARSGSVGQLNACHINGRGERLAGGLYNGAVFGTNCLHST